jgi:hypothetical protein
MTSYNTLFVVSTLFILFSCAPRTDDRSDTTIKAFFRDKEVTEAAEKTSKDENSINLIFIDCSEEFLLKLDWKKFNNTKNLTFKNTIIKEKTISLIPFLSTLHSVELDNCVFTYQDFKKLISSKFIEYIKLSNTAPDVSVLHEISRKTSLETLDLSHSKIVDKDIEIIANCSSLTSLSLSNTQITSNCLPQIERIKSLSELHIDNTNIEETGLSGSGILGKISVMFISINQINNHNLKNYKKTKSLKTIFVEVPVLDDPKIIAIRKLLYGIEIIEDRKEPPLPFPIIYPPTPDPKKGR